MIRALGVDEVGLVEPLWREMVDHHVEVAGWPVREAGEAWRRRREQYEGWVGSGTGWLLAALPEGAAQPDGYAMVTVHAPGPTFDLGDEVGDLESLAVAARARGTGVGTQLIAAARERLRERGVRHWSVSVVEANTGAVRLYEREGFRPFYRTLLEPLG